MPEADSRPIVAVYAERFLARQMTFVYGQISRLERHRPVALARYRENEDLFPWPAVHTPRPPGPIDRVRIRVRRRLRGLRGPTRRETAFWTRVVREEKPSLIHAHFGPGGLDMMPVARRTGVPLVVTFHGFGASQLLRLPAYRRQLPGLSRATSRCLCVCAPMVDRLARAGIDRDRMRVWHHGVDTGKFAFATRSRGGMPEFLQVSGLSEKKGVSDSIRAFARYLADGGRGTFRLAGDGPLREELLSLARELLPADRFAYLGPVDHGDLPRILARADVFVHPSVVAADGDREGTPTVIMEAMATGLPVVSTRHEGIPELVRDGRDGILLEEGDTEGIAGAMTRLADPSLRVEMGGAGAERIRADFEQGERNRELEDIYSEAVTEASSQ